MARDDLVPLESPPVNHAPPAPERGRSDVLPSPAPALPVSLARGSGGIATPSPAAGVECGASPRCSVKGCIFPATRGGGGQCLLHTLAEKEPKHFLSLQPSVLLLDQAKFGVPDADYDDSRARDRRRLAALRERFREEVA
jgi:hypothetical protein